MTNARQKLLKYIIEQQSATVEELSKVFKVTPANIRHHLSILSEQGSVKIVGQKDNPGKGRPTQIYSASLQTDRNNLDQLASALLSMMMSASQSDDKDRLLHQIARQLVSQYHLDRYNPTRRMYTSIRVLNQMKYQAHWEAHLEYPRIMLGHCPYQTMLTQHPEICQMDGYVLQELLDAPIRQVEKLSLNARGLPECIFFVNRHSSTY
jgi:predicted ArsR family transcriptional regulator